MPAVPLLGASPPIAELVAEPKIHLPPNVRNDLVSWLDNMCTDDSILSFPPFLRSPSPIPRTQTAILPTSAVLSMLCLRLNPY
jgi:hypothetical protein